MNKMVRVRKVIILILTIGVISATIGVAYQRFIESHTQGFPEAALYDPVTYKFDPKTIFASLASERSNVFLPLSDETEANTPEPSGTFSWDQADYLKIADAFHKYVWKETLDDWHLYWAEYSIDQCQDEINGIDAAGFLFYQHRTDRYVVHHIFIKPLYSEVVVADDYYDYTGTWKSIKMEETKIKSAEEALNLAENNGGRESRLAVGNECYIGIYFAPDVFEYKFLSGLTYSRNWGWSVTYWQGDASLIFKITIDPYAGKYQIQN